MFDYSEKVSYEVLEPGTYEAIIDNAEFKETDTGKKYISLKFKVRDDVNQPSQGAVVFDNIWEGDVYRLDGKFIKKEKYDALSTEEKARVITTKEYNAFKIRTLVQAQDNDEVVTDKNGVKQPNPNYITKFNNMEEVVLFLNGLCVQIPVTKYNDDKNGVERNQVEYKNIKRTKYHYTGGLVTPATPAKPAEPVQTPAISDDDLPF